MPLCIKVECLRKFPMMIKLFKVEEFVVSSVSFEGVNKGELKIVNMNY